VRAVVVDPERFAARLAAIGGVFAVCLGGSRARGEERPDSDWDFGLYYRGGIDTATVREIGLTGEVVEPGAWGRLMNGGAWLMVEGERVDLLYRDLATVEHWLAEAEAGRFQIDHVPGYLAGAPTYLLVGELALNRVLTGTLPKPTFPQSLRESAPRRWYSEAAFSLLYAEAHAARGDATACVGAMARSVLAVAHARLAERGAWVLNEKGLAAQAGLDDAWREFRLNSRDPETLSDAVGRLRERLGLARPISLKLDEPVRL
jgi:hypothetical protein